MIQINRSLVGITLLLAIVFPTAFAGIKAVLFAGAMFSSLAILARGEVRINRGIFLISIVFALVGIVYSWYGELAGNPGSSRVLTVMVVYPLAFPFLAFIYHEDDADRLLRLFLLSAWCLVVVDIAYILAGFVPGGGAFIDFISALYPEDAVIDNAETYFKFTLPNVSSLVFLVPFVVSAFLTGTKQAGRGKLAVLLVLMSILAVLSGRRALFLAFFVGPICAALVCLDSRKRLRAGRGRSTFWPIAALIGVIAVFVTYSNSLDLFVAQVSSIFDFEGNGSNFERFLQFKALVDGIDGSPILGSGAGAAAHYSRSATQPWAYELSYVAFVFQYGFLGFAIYLSGIVLLFFALLHAIKRKGGRGFEFFFLSGFISFMFANATNPYLAKFDYMWVIFVPFAILVAEARKKTGLEEVAK